MPSVEIRIHRAIVGEGIASPGPAEILQCAACLQLWPCEVERQKEINRRINRRIREIIAEFDQDDLAPTQTIPRILDDQTA